jgi:hypothetical protein
MNEAMTTREAPAESRVRRTGSVFLAQALFVGLLLGDVIVGLWTIARDQTRLAAAPAVLAGMALQNITTGDAALAMMERLHGKEIDLVDGWVAIYQRGGALWVGETTSEAAAEKLTTQMTEGIEDGNPMFRHLGTESFGSVTAHKVTDGSTTHYYYQLREKVVWIAAPQESGQRFVEEAIAALSKT